MPSLKDMSVQRKLMLSIFLTSMVAMLLMRGTLLFMEFADFKKATVQQLTMLGEVIATNSSAALDFDNSDDAAQILRALQADSHITCAALYDRNGKLFARYPENYDTAKLPPAPGVDGYRFESWQLAGFQPVVMGGKRLGTLYIQYEASTVMSAWLSLSLRVALGEVILILVLTYALSRWLQRQISSPILALAETSRAVSERGDFSLRAVPQGRDEVGRLTAAFNQMLAHIQEREAEIRQLNAELEQRVIERTAQLESANHAKSDFLANMSHELRTPLNAIIGFSEMLIDGKPGAMNPKQSQYIKHVLDSGKHLLELINDVLDLSKVEAGKMELYPEPFSVRRAIEAVSHLVAPMAQKKNLAISVRVEPATDEVTLDLQKFKQVLFNLLSNAVKFTPEGGRINILARPHAASQMELRVSDTGIGIKADDLDKLFKEFNQLDSGFARQYPGTGLGLALTRRIIELQHGTIQVESEPGRGSTFIVVLPRELAKETP